MHIMSDRKAQFFGRRHQVERVRRLIKGQERPAAFFRMTLADYYGFACVHACSHSVSLG